MLDLRNSDGLWPYTFLNVLEKVESLLNPENFLRLTQLPRLPLRKHLCLVYLISNTTGIINDQINLTAFQQVDGFYKIHENFQPGTRLIKTIDQQSSPGTIYLVAHDQQTLQEGYRQIRALEKYFYSIIVRKQHFQINHANKFTFLSKDNI